MATPGWALTLKVKTSVEAPIPVGSTLTSAAEVAGAADGAAMWYRFRVRGPRDADFRTMRDFSPNPSLDWSPGLVEGTYELEVTARNRVTGESSTQITSSVVVPRATDSAVISPTQNELVYIYSAPACTPGTRFFVSFTSFGGERKTTPELQCLDGYSMNVYLAGLRPESAYTVQHTLISEDGTQEDSPELDMQTNPLSFAVSGTRSLYQGGSSAEEGVLFQNRLFEYSVATDLSGNILWYMPRVTPYLTRPLPGGYFFALIENNQADESSQLLQIVDLASNVVLETNAARVNEQLDAMGKGRMTSFHHDAGMLPDGRIVALVATERKLTDVQGAGEVNVLGDMILVLNGNMEVEWVWDAFDHLDVTRKALLDEKCQVGGGGCPVFRNSEIANDWLHGNSVTYTPDGHLVYSARHMDWVIKIDFANGQGSGGVLWKLGKDGDFRFVGDEREPWFSHQHDAIFVDDRHLLIFDNGNTRRKTDESAHSRGQLWELDENARTARLVLNVDLGDYAMALGSAERLSNGNFHFGLGWMPNLKSQSLEYTPSGDLVTQIETDTQQYRSIRMRDLYHP